MKCLEGNNYRIKQAKKFRKRLLRHRDQLRVLHTRPERLQPTHRENLAGPPTVGPTAVSPGLTVSMPPPSSQVVDNANLEDAAHKPELPYAPRLTLLHQVCLLLTRQKVASLTRAQRHLWNCVGGRGLAGLPKDMETGH